MRLNKRTAADIALKIKFESQLERTMRYFFRNMASDVRVYYKNYEQIIDTRRYDVEINSILRQHYRKVSKAFESRLREELTKSRIHLETKELDARVSQRLNDYFYKRSIEQTSFISQTNAAEVYTAFQKVTMTAAKNGTTLNKNQLAQEASDEFERRGLGRAKTIGLTETQNPAEKTKDIEAVTITDNDVIAGGVVLRPDDITKTWSAILDDHTRIEHALADDQTVKQDEPFIVGGESLMFPGDDSMGASLENILNCRCNTDRAIELSELPDFVNQPENRAPQRGIIYYP